jgi:hypothetical protein
MLANTLGMAGGHDAHSLLSTTVAILLKSAFEFHALWHIFTGYAAYMSILLSIDLNYQLHLNTTKQPNSLRNFRQPVAHKLNKLYFYLTNELTEPKQ